jgi:hypothetical protein
MSTAGILRPGRNLLLVLALTSAAAFACGCQDVYDGNPIPCNGGCGLGFYCQEYCGPGCICGYCVTSGHGLCCKSRFTTLGIDTTDCDPAVDCGGGCGDCGPARAHASSHSAERDRVGVQRAWVQGESFLWLASCKSILLSTPPSWCPIIVGTPTESSTDKTVLAKGFCPKTQDPSPTQQAGVYNLETR